MKRNLRRLLLASVLPLLAYAQTPTPSPGPASPQPARTGPAPQGDLKSVLAQMDEAAKNFKSAQADVELTQYTEIVKDSSKQSGQAFFRQRGENHGKNMDVALFLLAEADPTHSDRKADRPPKPLQPKQVVVSGGSFSFFDPNTGQCTARKIGDYRADVETMMNLGFGGRGQGLLQDFDVTLAGWETLDNIQTARLELVPKSNDLKRFFTRLTLWIDPKRDVPIKQQRFESSGDYQLTHYTNIRSPGKVPDNLFHVRTCGNE